MPEEKKMITFAGESDKKTNKYLRYTSYNKSNISNNNHKHSIQNIAESLKFKVNTKKNRTLRNLENNLNSIAIRIPLLRFDREVIFTINHYRQGIP